MIWGAVPTVRVLVTGFGPFPGMPDNASATMMKALGQSAAAPGVEHFTEIIPVVWADARRVARDAIARVKPHAILHFGVSKRAAGFEIETRAINISGPKEDYAGVARPGKPLELSGKPVLHATLPPHMLLTALRRGGSPAQLSRNAGRYLCNALFYWSLAGASAGDPLVGFIHMPSFGAETGAQPRITPKDAAEGARLLIRASAQAVPRAKRSGSGNRSGLTAGLYPPPPRGA